MILAIVVLASLLVFNFVIQSQNYDHEWWDSDWTYRLGIDINNTDVNRTDWPVEYQVNFTQVLADMGISGTFDPNSTRVIEYNSTGSILHELPSQFDPDTTYNATHNALGTIVFEMNGTTIANTTRYYYIYFDIIENGLTAYPNYATDLTYNYSGNLDEFAVNNSLFRWKVDTERGENSSGIYNVQGVTYENEILRSDPALNKTVEYSQYSNGTNTFGFDFRNNFTFKHIGPVRIVVEQIGQETLWNKTDNRTNDAYMIKRYTFYRQIDWMRIEQILVNNASVNITRNSTIAGAIALDINYSMDLPGPPYFYNQLNKTDDPGSYGWAAETFGSWWVGIVNVEENGTSNFYGTDDVSVGRIGIQLGTTNITVGNSISQTSYIQFNESGQAGAENYFDYFANQSITSFNISQHTPEVRTIGIDATFNVNVTTQASVFNRNETVLIRANITDLYNLHDNVNVTLDLGGSGDINLTLYDDGTHYDGAASDNLYANTYNLSDSAVVGIWNATITVYNATGHTLNVTILPFNVSNTYNVTVNITNPTGFTGRMVNTTVTVTNQRGDIPIIGALVNCSFLSTEVPQSNVTDNGDGTYFVEFGAPNYVDLFTLSCVVSRNNNTGLDTDEFTCEEYHTNVSISVIPDNLTYNNVTSFENQTFDITVIAKNIANGSAYEPNITISFPNTNITANETFSQCSNILISKNCTKTYKIIVYNATPSGEYMVNVSIDWRNFDGYPGSSNETMLNVTVLDNPILEVAKTQVIGIVASNRTLKNIDNFTVRSRGNQQLTGIDFNVTGFTSDFEIQFLPTDITTLGVGVDQVVQIFANTTNNVQPGEYNGTINITTTNNGEHIINLTIAVTGTNMSIAVNTTNYTAANVTWYSNESFFVFVNASNTKNATAYNSSIILNFSDSGITANETNHDCGNVPKASNCEVYFLVTILNGTRSGNYSMNVSVQWANPEYGIFTNTSTVNITVLSNITFEISTDEVSSNITHGLSGQVGIIYINSSGNDPVTNITATVASFSDYNITLSVMPVSIVTLDGSYPGGIEINASVPYGFSPGVYNGTINVTTNNSIFKEINLTVEVPVSRNWTMNVTYCEQFQLPSEGVACYVNINNTGNIDTYIDITPAATSSSMYNNTWPSLTEFNLTKASDQNITVNYNVTGQPLVFYYANYTFNATQSEATPGNRTLQIVLNPFIKPDVSVALVYNGVVQNQSEQTDQVWIYANVTDLSGAGVDDGNVTVTVTRPDGSNSTIDMFHYSGTSPVTRWEARYPNDPVQGVWGNTTEKGYYNVTVLAIDNRGKNETITYQLYVYSKLTPYFMTTSQYYYSYIGASNPIIYFKSLDFTDNALSNANVSFVIRNSNYSTVYNSTYAYGNLTTNAEGFITDPESGGIYLDTLDMAGYPIDNYTVTAESYYYETTASAMISDESNYTFELLESAGTLANVLVYPTYYTSNNIVKFRMWITNSMGSLVDPQNMNVTVYDPADNEFFNRSLSQMTRVSQGVYIYNHAMPASPAVGIYDVTLEVTGQDNTHTYDFSAFRIGTGGPYDVWIDPIENEVYQSDYLDFGINMKNMGDSQTENLVEYWITGLGDNNTWNYGTFSMLVDGGAEVLEMKDLYIFDYQPIGSYMLSVKVTYDPYNNIYATANESFSVVTRPSEPNPEPSPGGGGEDEGGEAGGGAIGSAEPAIEITKYSPDIGMEIDSVKYPVVEVKNTGGAKLTNVMLRITGIPSPWIIGITPEKTDLTVGNSTTFTIMLKVPPTAEAKEYSGTIIADGNITIDEKPFTLALFSTRSQLIRWELDRLKKALLELEMDIDGAKKVGKDVSEVEPYINEIQGYIDSAEEYLQNKMYDESLSEIQIGWNQLEKARYYLSIAPFVEILIETIFPPWLIILLVVLGVVIVVLLLFVRKMRGVFDKVFRLQVPKGAPGAAAAVKSTVMVEKIREKEKLEKEKASVSRVLSLLEREHQQGLISDSAFADLKRRNEEKLKKIDQMMSSTE